MKTPREASLPLWTTTLDHKHPPSLTASFINALSLRSETLIFLKKSSNLYILYGDSTKKTFITACLASTCMLAHGAQNNTYFAIGAAAING